MSQSGQKGAGHDVSSPKDLLQVSSLGKQVSGDAGTLTLLADVHFRVSAGETLAIVGASGSGKSTLLGLLAGLDDATTGQVVLDGLDWSQASEDARAAWRAQRLGFVFQSFQLLPALSALENVMLPLELAGVPVTEAQRRALLALDQVGLGDRVAHLPKQLSGGEQQRVALARAFAPQPRLILADEPTGNLDAVTGQKIIDLLFDLNKQCGTTLILVTHDAELANRCQRVLRLQGGRLLVDKGESSDHFLRGGSV